MSDLAKAATPRGDIVLRRRVDGAVELRVNGVFVMDTMQTSSERMLARAGLDAVTTSDGNRGLTVFMGGLGLGFTLQEVLADHRVVGVVLAEIEEALVSWHRTGVIALPPSTMAPLSDPRVAVVIGDVRDIVSRQAPSDFDVMLLDVDNGPDHLVYDANAAIYRRDFLQLCVSAVRPGGLVAIWSAAASAALTEAMEHVFASVQEWRIPVILGSRATTYHLFVGRSATSRQ